MQGPGVRSQKLGGSLGLCGLSGQNPESEGVRVLNNPELDEPSQNFIENKGPG